MVGGYSFELSSDTEKVVTFAFGEYRERGPLLRGDILSQRQEVGKVLKTTMFSRVSQAKYSVDQLREQ